MASSSTSGFHIPISELSNILLENTRVSSCTVHVSNIPQNAVAKDLFNFFEAALGSGSVVICEIKVERDSLKSRGFGFVQFETEAAVSKAYSLARNGSLCFQNSLLCIKQARRSIKLRPDHDKTRMSLGSLHLGCMISHDAMYVLRSAVQCVTIEIDYQSKAFKLIVDANKTHKMEWRFRDIYEIYSCKIQGRITHSILIKAWLAPRIYESLVKAPQHISASSFICSREMAEPLWRRTVDFTPGSIIGQSYAFCVELPNMKQATFDEIFHKLADFQITSYNPVDRQISLVKGTAYSTCQTVVPILGGLDIDKLPFEMIFRINSLLQQGYLSGPSLNRNFFQLLDPLVTSITCTNWALQKLLRRKETCYDPVMWLKNQIKEFQKGKIMTKSVKPNLDDGQMWVRRILVSPCRVYCTGPEIDLSNRVTRHFMDSIDNFIRVSFVEEDYDNLASTALTVPEKASPCIQYTDVFDRILSVLRDGITLGKKHFEFLAFSSSQLRENSVWMFSSNQTMTAEGIRKWMGDFLRIRNVAKCAARMGQCFSSSTETLHVYPFEVKDLLDIKRTDGMANYCFSDGIGKISPSFAAEVSKKFRYKNLDGRVPSAFQIRYGGYKGVVAVDPHCSHKLSLRPSMKKFPSTHTSLEILNWTRFIPCYLNRQIITLLSTLEVPDSIFEDMQEQVTSQLNKILLSGEAAIEVLEMCCGGKSHHLMMEMLLADYQPSTEPFLDRMMHTFRASELMNIRKKARIFNPKGRLLMGCLDESSSLEYGEAFVQVSPTPRRSRRIFNDGLKPVRAYGIDGKITWNCIIEGKIIVAKNPCVHPGDIRVLNAVNNPALHHMVDCIVFPQKGPRPHPNECSGSDLDGDIYFVSWDEKLIPPKVYPPMDYQSPAQQELDHAVTIEEIQKHFVKYMVNDSLGLIANAHTVFADYETGQARSPKCLELAKLFSIAVDFPKTGVPAVLPMDLRPIKYPDFMEKEDKRQYKSERILGKLYRLVEIDDKKPASIFTREDANKFFDKEMVVSGFEHYLEEAVTMKNWYDEELIGLMNQYGVESEAEILTGNILSLSRYYRRRPGEVKERIQNAVSALKKDVRAWFGGYSDDKGNCIRAYDNEELAKASAWYYVTYHPNYVGPANYQAPHGHIHLLSFPWVVYDRILAIKKSHQGC